MKKYFKLNKNNFGHVQCWPSAASAPVTASNSRTCAAAAGEATDDWPAGGELRDCFLDAKHLYW